MTETIQTDADTPTKEATEAAPAEEFLYLDPADIVIGTNVRTDLRADHKEFRKSIKERGVLEAVTVYRNEDGQHVLLRGQRRTVTAAEVFNERGVVSGEVLNFGFLQKPAVAYSYSLISGSSLRCLWNANLMSAMLATDNTENQIITWRHVPKRMTSPNQRFP